MLLKKVERKNIEHILALTPVQEGMLFYYLKDPSSDVYFEQLSLEISGEIFIEIFEKAWNFVVETNEMLRVIFRWEHVDNPLQVILKKHQLKPRYYDLSEKENSEEKKKQVENIKREDRKKNFDLREVPFRVILCKLETNKYLMIISHHHILFDGWSNGIILREFFNAYIHLSSGKECVKPVKTIYKEFVKWMQERDIGGQEKFWRNYLRGGDTETELSIKRKKGKGGSTAGSEVFQIKLEKEIKTRLEGFVKKHKITLASFLYSAWGLLLQKYNNTNDVVFGTTVSGRTVKVRGIEDMVGLFINTIPLRVQTFPDEKTGDLLYRIDNALKVREDYEQTSLVNIKEYSEIHHQEELFDTIAVIENYPLHDRLKLKNSQLYVNSYSMVEISHYDLIFGITIFDEIEITFNYIKDIFDNDTIVRLAGHCKGMIENIMIYPGIPASALEIISVEEKKQVLLEFNKTEAQYPRDKTIYGLFEQQATGIPDHIALVGLIPGKEYPYGVPISITYKEINGKSTQLARLLKEKGVTGETIVAIMVGRSVEMIFGILGILKAGGAYMPIDPDYPEERVQYMLSDSGAGMIVTTGRLVEVGKKAPDIVSLDFSTIHSFSPSTLSPSRLRPESSPVNRLAYIIYTSGTTGIPKGSLIQQGNLLSLMFHEGFLFDFGNNDVWTMFHSYCFDFSVWEMYGALLYGGKLIIIPQMATLDMGYYLEILKNQGVTVLNQTPSVFYHLMNLELKNSTKDLKIHWVIFGGESLNPKRLRHWHARYPSTMFINMYGITETTVHVTFKKIGYGEMERATSNIGKALPTLSVYIIGKSTGLLSVGIPGELYVGGEGVGRGYLNRPELTRDKFVENPYKPGKILYRSGDLAKWNTVGELEYLGRIDQQVKIRGFRIEPGEIENRLLTHEHVKEAVVLAIKDYRGDQYLCAYFVSHQENLAPKLREFLSGRLPDYMIPTIFMQLERIPLTSSGKVDWRALPGPLIKKADKIKAAPRNDLERKLVDIWSAVLEKEKDIIGIDSNFFELGGHSLKATQLLSLIYKEIGVKIPLAEIFMKPTIKLLSPGMKELAKEKYFNLEPAEKKEYYALSSAQERLYTLQLMDENSTAYNIPIMVELEGNIDTKRLEDTFKSLIKRHESFRTSFELIEKEPVQVVHPYRDIGFKIEYHGDGDAAKIIEDFLCPFDLGQVPLLRAGLVNIRQEKFILLVDMHHIAADAVSMGIFIKDFSTLYAGNQPPPLRIKYKDYCEWQGKGSQKEELRKQEDFWLKLYKDYIPGMTITADFPRTPGVGSLEGKVDFEITPDTTEKLRRLISRNVTTLFIVLLTVYNVLLLKYTKQEDIVVGTPIVGRPHPDLQNIIGMFVNMLAMRNFPRPHKTFEQFLLEVKENSLKAFENQDYPYERLIAGLGLERTSSRNPLAEIVFDLENTGFKQEVFIASENIHWRLKPYELGNKESKFDLELGGSEGPDSISCYFKYRIGLFKRETIQRICRHFINIIEEIVQNPEVTIAEIKMLDQEEKEDIVKKIASQKNPANFQKPVQVHKENLMAEFDL